MGLIGFIKGLLGNNGHAADLEASPLSARTAALQNSETRLSSETDAQPGAHRPSAESELHPRSGHHSRYSVQLKPETIQLKRFIEYLKASCGNGEIDRSPSEVLKNAELLSAGLEEPIVNKALERLKDLANDESTSSSPADGFRHFVERIYDPVTFDSSAIDVVEGKRFALTGEFSITGGKSALKEMVEAAGGKVTEKVTGATNYIVAGSLGSPDWGLGKYGGAIKKDVEAHLAGKEWPKLLTESSLVSHLETNYSEAAQIRKKREEQIERQRKATEVVGRSFRGLTDGQQKAFDLVKSGRNVYLSGLGGTGKSYIVDRIIEWAKTSGKNVIVCAPTGIAALNVGGTTIHRALKILPEVTLRMSPEPKITKNSPIPECDLMIVDEISMCRLDLFDYLSSVLNKAAEIRKARGKKRCQLVVVGDFCQLAPVIQQNERKILEAKYGFDVKGGYPFMGTSWDDWDFASVELTQAIRQRDAAFVTALNMCRVNDLGGVRWIEEHSSPKKIEGAIYLCGRNEEADRENKKRLDALAGPAVQYDAESRGTISAQDKPTADHLVLKPHARVMALVNDGENTYMNGSLGTVVKCEDEAVLVDFDGAGPSWVPKHEWDITEPKLVNGKMTNDTIGIFVQIPLRLAWALTIHKAQGQTFEAANINPECWECGQLYTALSRLTDVKNLHLIRRVHDSSLRTSLEVVDFLSGEYQRPKPKGESIAAQATADPPSGNTGSSPHRWTEEEDRFVREHPGMTAREIAATIGVTPKAVERRRSKLRGNG